MRSSLRPVAAVAAGVLTLTTLATGLGAAPAQAAGPDDRAATWLSSQLTDGLVHNDQFDFDDLGLTLDVGLALAEVGDQRPALRRVRNAMAQQVDAYTTYESDVYANAVAKVARFAQVAGADARSYGGVDLVDRLNRRVVKKGAAKGRITDKTTGADYGNTIGQAFAVGALHRANSRHAGKATGFLIAQQCRGGWFRLGFTTDSGDGQTCRTAPKAQKGPSTDATALAVIELSGLPRADRTKATRGAVTRALNWLDRTQRRNGSFGSDALIPASNTNSTGLAAWALGSNDRCRLAARAATWVRDLQVRGDVSGTPLAGESGAIAYDRAGYDQGAENGIDETNADQWRRASAQAAPALAFVGGC